MFRTKTVKAFDVNWSCVHFKWLFRVAKWMFTLHYMKKWFILSRQLNTHTHTHKLLPFLHSPPVPMGFCLPPLSLLWLTGSQGARWTEWWFSWRALPACFRLGVKQITLCMHEYITSAAVIILGKAKAFGTCALLPTWLLCSCCHCCTIKWVWMFVVRVSAWIRCFFIYRVFSPGFGEGDLHHEMFTKLKLALCNAKTIILWIQLWTTHSFTVAVSNDCFFSTTQGVPCWQIYRLVKPQPCRAEAISTFLWSSAFGPLDLGQRPGWL